jgi:large subunit ribosomal protein L28e
MSGDLQWLLLRKNNSFIVKGGHGPAFSREKVSWIGVLG